jgi:hypothetical protein
MAMGVSGSGSCREPLLGVCRGGVASHVSSRCSGPVGEGEDRAEGLPRAAPPAELASADALVVDRVAAVERNLNRR